MGCMQSSGRTIESSVTSSRDINDLTKSDSGPSEVKIQVHERKKVSIHSLNPSEQKAVYRLFDDYRKSRRSSAESVREYSQSSSGKGRATMTKAGLKRVFRDVDDKLFDFLWNLFDSNDSGAVDADEFGVRPPRGGLDVRSRLSGVWLACGSDGHGVALKGD